MIAAGTHRGCFDKVVEIRRCLSTPMRLGVRVM
jgi:hypothetical protein